MKKKLDKQTDKLMMEGQYIQDLVQSPAWKTVKKMLLDNIISLDSISAVPKTGRSNEDVLIDIKIREGVISIIMDWISKVEGEAKQFKSVAELMKEQKEDIIVQQFE